MEPGIVVRKNKRTVSVTNVLLIMLIIFILAVGMLSYLGYQTTGESPVGALMPTISDSPRFLFNIYGDKLHSLKSPMAVFVSDDEMVYVANTEGHTVEVFRANGTYAFSFGGYGNEPGKMAYPYGITETSDGSILVAESGNNRIQKFTRQGKYLGVFLDSAALSEMKKPGPLYTDSSKRIYIGDLTAQKVFVVNEKGARLRTYTGFLYPHGIAVDKKGKIYVSDGGSNRVVILDQSGKQLGTLDKWGENKSFSMVRGAATDSNGRVFVADTVVSSIRVFDSKGKYLTSFGNQGMENGNFIYPHGIFIDRKGKLYIADWGNNRIQVWGY